MSITIEFIELRIAELEDLLKDLKNKDVLKKEIERLIQEFKYERNSVKARRNDANRNGNNRRLAAYFRG